MSILSSDQEDIATFCSYAQLDASEYKVFERPKRSPGARPQVSMESRNRRLLAAAPTEIPSPRPTDAGNRTLPHLGAPPALARIAVTSCAGGSGASTIAATLSRLFTIHGHSVLVHDSTRDRTISYFFGTRPVEQNILRTFMGDGNGRGALHLCFSAPEESAAQLGSHRCHVARRTCMGDYRLRQEPCTGRRGPDTCGLRSGAPLGGECRRNPPRGT